MHRGITVAGRRAIGWAGTAGIAAGASVGTATLALRLMEAASRTHAASSLALILLAVLAAVGALVCAHLAAVSVLAAWCWVAPAQSRSGRGAMLALRVLAPRLARRIGRSATVATAAVLIAPPLVAAPSPGDLHEAADAPAAATSPATGLTWGAAPIAPAASSPTPLVWSAPLPPAAGSSDEAAQCDLVTVRRGDSLWRLAEQRLGPGAADPRSIHLLAQEIHQLNLAVIGEDPDRLVPGQILLIPCPTPHRTAQEQP